MVEFSLVAPMFFLVLTGILVVALIVLNQTALQNRTRDAVRAAAICGDKVTQSLASPPLAALPDGTPCSQSNVNAYIVTTVRSATGGQVVFITLTCYDTTGALVPSGSSGPLTNCRPGYRIELSTSFQQPTYLPLVGALLSNNGSSTTRRLTADASATCEQ